MYLSEEKENLRMHAHRERGHVTTQQDEGHLQAKERGLKRNQTGDTILDLQPPEKKPIFVKSSSLCFLLWQHQIEF